MQVVVPVDRGSGIISSTSISSRGLEVQVNSGGDCGGGSASGVSGGGGGEVIVEVVMRVVNVV